MSTASVSVISGITECQGGCGRLVTSFEQYCRPCRKLADEYEAKEPRSCGDRIAAAGGVVAMAASFFLMSFGIISIAWRCMGHR